MKKGRFKAVRTRHFISTTPSLEIVASADTKKVVVRHTPTNTTRSFDPEALIGDILDSFIGVGKSKMVQNKDA